MDQLEKFIIENRDKLDRYEPGPDVWARIEKVPPKRMVRLTSVITRAAIVVFIVASSLFLYTLTSGNNPDGYRISSHGGKLSPEITETEIYYNTRFNNLLLEAKPLMTSNPALETELMKEVSQLDSICEDIRRDLKDNISNQEVIEALVMNYRIKVTLLEDMLDILNSQTTEEKENNTHHEL